MIKVKEGILMNQKTAKLLRKYSRYSGKSINELKETWMNLSAKEKAKMRAELESKLNINIDTENQAQAKS